MIFSKPFTIQGHRGARGLLPENTIASCCQAVALGVDGLEIDLVVSKDNQLIVSHEPWMSRHFCTFPDGKRLNTEGVLLRKLTVAEIQKFDCGSLGNPDFKSQKAIKCYKPTFYELVTAVHAFCEKENLKKPFWNIEVKSHPKWFGRLIPTPSIFAGLLILELKKVGLWGTEMFYISSFDKYLLRVIRKKHPLLKLAFLTENRHSFNLNMKHLGFRPDIYSPYFKYINKKIVEQAHKRGVKVVTWTVNNAKTADILRGWQVDGLITDFPNYAS